LDQTNQIIEKVIQKWLKIDSILGLPKAATWAVGAATTAELLPEVPIRSSSSRLPATHVEDHTGNQGNCLGIPTACSLRNACCASCKPH